MAIRIGAEASIVVQLSFGRSRRSSIQGIATLLADQHPLQQRRLDRPARRMLIVLGQLTSAGTGSPKGIWVWDSQGHHIGTIEMPEQPANLNWGDSDYRTLYITATTSVYKLCSKAVATSPPCMARTT